MSAALVLTGGPHPFAQTTPLLVELLEAEGCAATVSDDPDAVATLLADRYAALREAHAYATPPGTARAIDRWVRTGGRVLACHGAPICFDDWPGWGELLGARWDWDRSSHPPLGPVEVTVAVPDHPLVAGLEDFTVTDECYGFLERTAPIEALLTGEHSGTTHPLLWEHRPDAGHVIVSLLGHGPESFEHPAHAALLRRSVRRLLDPVAGVTR